MSAAPKIAPKILPIDQQRARHERDERDDARTEMPDADVLVETQVVESVYRLHEDSRQFPKYPWRALADLAGPMCPEDLILVAARTGGGKSLFLQNLFDSLIARGLAGLYIGLEQSPDILRVKWACLRADVSPKLVLAPGDFQGTQLHAEALTKVQRELEWQRSEEIRRIAHFSATRLINAKLLKNWVLWADDHGCRFVVVDHIDRMQHGNGSNAFHELSTTVRLAKELAADRRIVMLVASQVGRPADSLEQFMPPSLHALRGGGTKEEEADTVIGVYRPLRRDVTEKDLTAVRRGLMARDLVLESGTMGVMLLKHRLDGPAAGRVVKLGVRHQRIYDLAGGLV